jgi:hypothetical protein
MSLRGFHIFFILCAIILSGWFAFWNYENYQVSNASPDLLTTAASALIAAGLVVYMVWFLKKIQKAGKA